MYKLALIFAGGVGARMGSETPKQYLEWNGRAILIHTLHVFDRHSSIDGIVVVCKKEWISYTNELILNAKLEKILSIVPGGDTALESQYNGLLEIDRLFGQENESIVLIHDGVRPLIDSETIQRNIDSAIRYGSTVTVTKAVETVIQVDSENHVTNILDREFCRMAKAPQTFRYNDIFSVHKRALKENKHNFIDSASMMQAYGYQLYTVDGEPENIKITTPSDYYMFLGISKSREEKSEN